MVMGTDPPLVDVAIIIEDTALGGAHMSDLRTSYIQPTLEHFNGGAASDLDFSSIDCSSSFSLIPFHASDCLPKPSAKVIGPFTSIKRILNVFDKLEFTGGMGESYSSGHEGIASALQAFEDVKKMRRNPDLAVTQHLVFISNSPTYDIPVLENYKYNGMVLDQLANIVQENNISLSVISQRKIPFLYKLFEKCGGDLKQAQEKNYAKDPRHLVLLRGYSLQERPLTPKPPIPSTSPIIPNVASVAGYPVDPRSKTPNLPLQVTSSQPEIKQEINPVQQPNINMPRPIVQPNMMVGPGGRMAMPNQGAGMVGQVPNSGIQGAIPQPQPQFSGMRQQGPQAQSLIRPGVQQGQQQQPGVMPKASMVPGGPIQTGTELLRTRLNDKMNAGRGNQQPVAVQQPGMQNTTLKGLLDNRTPGQPNATMPNLVSQLNRLPAPMQQPGPGLMPGQPGGVMQAQPGMAMGVQPGAREREVIWKGELEWQEKVKDGPADQKISHSVNCTVSTSKENGVPEVKPDNWPAKLIMQLIPKSLVQTIGGQYFRNSKSVLFHPNECESLDALTKVMGTGFAGCVHFTGVQACDIKVLILLYSNDKKAYLGFIPNDQASFVDRIRTVIQQQKTGQQVRAQGQIGGPQMVGGPGQQMGGQQMGVGQQIGGQQQMGMGGGQMGMGMQQGQVVSQGQMMGQQGQMMGQQGQMRMSQPGLPAQQSMMGQQQQQPGMMMGGGNSVMISQGQNMPNMSVGGQSMAQQGQPGMVMQAGGQTMMMNSNMGQQQVRMQSQVMRGPGQMELQYVRMGGQPQPQPGQRMMGAGPGGMGNPGLRQILQQQPGMMTQPGNVQGGMMQMQQRMGGPPGMAGMSE